MGRGGVAPPPRPTAAFAGCHILRGAGPGRTALPVVHGPHRAFKEPHVAEIEIQPVTPPSAQERYGDIVTALSELTRVLSVEESMPETLQRILELAMRLIPGCHAASVTVLDAEGRPATAASTSAENQELDQRQYALGDGPCLDAARRHGINRCRMGEAEQTWPEFTAIATSMGLRSYLSAGMVADDRPVGALNLSSRDVDGFDALDETFIAMFSVPAAAVIAGRDRYERTRGLAVQLERALDSRATIDRAVGIIMAQSNCDAEQAFERLRRSSNNQNVKLRDLAGRIVSQVSAKGRGLVT
ncbi:GAF and ANTAR domain-containing protein [Spinactinospora alkalitolerans]|uniref:GAF and ANTAR domain-containing protein n=1 Tax=Spinactinospora alkalitolerans TaxID=687207 RepID=UPI0035E42502